MNDDKPELPLELDREQIRHLQVFIARRLQQLGFKQEFAARIFNVKQSTVSKWIHSDMDDAALSESLRDLIRCF